MKPDTMKVLLTGATGGIGAALAARLAEQGARLLLTGRNEAKLDRLRDRLSAKGYAVDAVAADLDDPGSLERLVEAAKRFEGGVNVLVNNAGVNRFGRFLDQPRDAVAAIVNTNVVAPMRLTHALLPQLETEPEAMIVNVGSIVGSIGLPGQVAYSSSKFALHGFSEALRRELGNSRIKVVYVAPRATDTDMNDAAQRAVNEQTGTRSDTPEHVARVIANAMHKAHRERFLGWPERLFVKVNALFPGLVDRSVSKQADLLDEPAPESSPSLRIDGVKQ
ncbi:MAG: SDR family oxidoreductase [Woeseiaceae bacterium]|jgi:short-subunit dehydrogenase|nr:SDR family oxidoreductase [Woeseiaceae bacterium]